MIGALIARKAVAGAFDAMNRHDLAKFMSAWRDDGVFVYPGEIPASGTFRGKSAVERKVFLVQDFIFDLGENFRRNWSAPEVTLHN